MIFRHLYPKTENTDPVV